MRHNPFAELYVIRGWGDWCGQRQGLYEGMDLLDWMRFVLCATWVIRQDPNRERRLRKIQRLYIKAMRVYSSPWIILRFPAHMQALIADTQEEIDSQD